MIKSTITTAHIYAAAIQNATPSAFVAINKSRLKQYEHSKYYLEKDREFQIELKNPTQDRYLAKIEMNGKLISESGIILEPNSHHFIDRFIDSNEKFKFNVFDVDNVSTTKAARNRNGSIKVFFYKEEIIYQYISNLVGKSDPYNSFFCQAGTGDPQPPRSFTTSATIQKSIESGRVEKGSESKQEFKSGYGNFSSTWTAASVFQLLPISQQPVGEQYKVRLYCTNCGIRIKNDNWKFCPNCGNKY